MPGPSLRIVEQTTLDAGTEYCALSYCWGGSKQKPTTAANIAARLVGLDFHELPKTLHDAVLIAANVDQKYLWVDSLYTIQGHVTDSLGDWDRHVSIMGLIYRHAYCTIFVSDATSADEGLLNGRGLKLHVRGCTGPINNFGNLRQRESTPRSDLESGPRVLYVDDGALHWDGEGQFTRVYIDDIDYTLAFIAPVYSARYRWLSLRADCHANGRVEYWALLLTPRYPPKHKY